MAGLGPATPPKAADLAAAPPAPARTLAALAVLRRRSPCTQPCPLFNTTVSSQALQGVIVQMVPQDATSVGAVANTSAAFVPPKPKLFERTARGPAGRARGPSAALSRPASNGGSGATRLAVGGAWPLSSASSEKMASTAPAAPSRCPVAPLVEDTASGGWPDAEVAASPNTAAIACCSMSSPAGGAG